MSEDKQPRSRFEEWAEQEQSDVHFQKTQFDRDDFEWEGRTTICAPEGNKHWDEGPEDLYISQIDDGVEITEQYAMRKNFRTGRFNEKPDQE